MKTTINKKAIFIMFCLMAYGMTFFVSCKKEKPAPTPPPANGTLMLHLHTNVDTNEVDYFDTVYTMTGGRKISVTKAQLYLSNITLIKLDGSTYTVPGTIILKKMEIEPYTVGSVPSGNYKSIRFDVGLSPTTNASTPASADSTLNRPDMWFGVAAQPAGFIFTNFQGKIDTTTAANGTIAQMQAFSYKIGTNANLKTVTMPDQNYTVTPNGVQYIHIIVDYSKLFTGVQLNVNSNLGINTTADNGTPLGTQVTNNISSMFIYE